MNLYKILHYNTLHSDAIEIETYSLMLGHTTAENHGDSSLVHACMLTAKEKNVNAVPLTRTAN